MRDYQYEKMMGLPVKEREKTWKEKLGKQVDLLKKKGVELDFYGPAWGSEHDYVTVIKTDKAWDEMNSIIGEWNDDWFKTQTYSVSMM